MQVVFPAVLDGVVCDGTSCACRDAVAAGAVLAGGAAKRRRTKGDTGDAALPAVEIEAALVAGSRHLAAGGAVADPSVVEAALAGRTGLRAGYADLPVFAWTAGATVELSFRSICPRVQAALAAADEATALANADGGWRQPLHVFRHAGGLDTLRLTSRSKLSLQDYLELREITLDLIGDPTSPPLARLARLAALTAVVVDERKLPAQIPPLTGRIFLAFRGFLEGRVASAPVEQMAAFAADLHMFWGDAAGLSRTQLPELLNALGGDWREAVHARLVDHEKDLAPAFEGWLSMRLLAVPIDRDTTLQRAWAELFEAWALSLRYAAAIAEVLDEAVNPTIMVAALALAEHFVSTSAQPLPSFSVPGDLHERGPRMADLDMTLESIC